MAVGASANRDSGKDRPIYVRIFGRGKIYWYVIEEKSPVDDVDDDNRMIGCESDNDRIRRLSLLCSDFGIDEVDSAYSNSIAVINSIVYLIGGDIGIQKKKDAGEYIAYRHLDLDLGVGEWRPDGGNLVNCQYGGAAVGPDGFIYTVGDNIYRFSPGGRFHEELSSPPSIYDPCLLGLTRNKLFIYSIGEGVEGANVMLSFDLESRKWDVLDDNFHGKWSTGVVLYDDRYLFSFGIQNPICQEEGETPGIYVFDIKLRQWLPEPVKGLPTNGKVLPYSYTPDPDPDPEVFVDTTFSAYLLQIGKQDDRKLALLWDGHATHPESHGPPTSMPIRCQVDSVRLMTTPSSSLIVQQECRRCLTSTCNLTFFSFPLANKYIVLLDGPSRLS